jgi:hypothetical protein
VQHSTGGVLTRLANNLRSLLDSHLPEDQRGKWTLESLRGTTIAVNQSQPVIDPVSSGPGVITQSGLPSSSQDQHALREHSAPPVQHSHQASDSPRQSLIDDESVSGPSSQVTDGYSQLRQDIIRFYPENADARHLYRWRPVPHIPSSEVDIGGERTIAAYSDYQPQGTGPSQAQPGYLPSQ